MPYTHDIENVNFYWTKLNNKSKYKIPNRTTFPSVKKMHFYIFPLNMYPCWWNATSVLMSDQKNGMQNKTLQTDQTIKKVIRF